MSLPGVCMGTLGSPRRMALLALVVGMACNPSGALGTPPSDPSVKSTVPSAFPPPDTRSTAAALGIPAPSMESGAASSTVATAAATSILATSRSDSEYHRPWNACRILVVGGGGCLGALCGGSVGALAGHPPSFALGEMTSRSDLVGGVAIGAAIGALLGVLAADHYACKWCD